MHKAHSLIHSIFRDFGREEDLRLHEMASAWGGLFQPPLSLHTAPAFLKKGQLLINVDSAQWLQEISFHTEEMIKRLDSFGVKDIRLRVGRVRHADPERRKGKNAAQETRSARRALSAVEKSLISDMTSPVKDPELKDSIQRALKSAFEAKGRR